MFNFIKKLIISNRPEEIESLLDDKDIERIKNEMKATFINKTYNLIDNPAPYKKTILIMDDNYGSVLMLKNDIDVIDNLAAFLRGQEMRSARFKGLETNLIELLTQSDIDFLKNFYKTNYNIILATSDMAGFQVIDSLRYNNLKVDFAMLDLILGGYKHEDDVTFTVDGIDVAAELKKTNPGVHYFFYTGCAFGVHSKELIKYKKLFNGEDIRDVTIFKGPFLQERSLNIIKLLQGSKHVCAIQNN